MKRTSMRTCLAATLIALPAAAFAAPGYAVRDANLRAGPSNEYPVVLRVRQRVALEVIGCMNDYRWCDVVAGPYRGWMYAGNIAYPYQGAYGPVLHYGPAMGIGISSFVLGSYWDDHYRGRPWYAHRDRWVARPFHYQEPRHPMPPPPHMVRPEHRLPPPPVHGIGPDHRQHPQVVRPEHRPSPPAHGVRPEHRPSPPSPAPGVRRDEHRQAPPERGPAHTR